MTTVLTCGTFDVLHLGHLHVFEKAKEYGDRLVVVVARDKNVQAWKGMLPYHNEQERKRMLESITIIDEVRLGSLDSPYEVLQEVRPDIIAIGYDQVALVDKLAKKITEYGLETQIVRLPPLNEARYKSSKIKQSLGLQDFIGDENIDI